MLRTYDIETIELRTMLLNDSKQSFETSIQRLKAWTNIEDMKIRLKTGRKRRKWWKQKYGQVVFEFSGTWTQVHKVNSVLDNSYFETAFVRNDKSLLLFI